MQKLPLVSSRDLIKYLSKHGFTYIHTRGSHHVLLRQTERIVVPERTQIGKGLPLCMYQDHTMLKEFISKLDRAYPNLFRYVIDPNITGTNNAAE